MSVIRPPIRGRGWSSPSAKNACSIWKRHAQPLHLAPADGAVGGCANGLPQGGSLGLLLAFGKPHKPAFLLLP